MCESNLDRSLISAWAAANRVVLGRVATEAKSDEITSIPQLLALLRIKGCIVIIDAMGCQTKIAERIIEQEGDYVLTLKGNQSALASEVDEVLIDADVKDYAGMESELMESVEQRPRVYRNLLLPYSGRPLRGVAQRPMARHEHDRHGRVATHG